jgi:L,D-peptidoglycan transpeptidase YkuD (ErfK/YbiS/YcfS/YnhG family)
MLVSGWRPRGDVAAAVGKGLRRVCSESPCRCPLSAGRSGRSGGHGPAGHCGRAGLQPLRAAQRGQTKFSGFGANRVTFATATTRNTSLLTITGCVRSGNRYLQEWQDWGYGGQYGFAAQNREWEDTYRSPTGSFSFTEALGRSNPGTALKYYKINYRSRWGGEWNRNYNQYFEGAGGEADENLWTFMNQGYYEQAAVINYNRPPDSKTVHGASYAIFFHAGRAPSAGCVSTSLATVTRLLRTNRPGDRIIMGAVDDVFTPYSSNPFGAITAKYARTGGPAGWLGNPASREMTGRRSGGAYQVFRGGSIYWSAAGGAHTIGGAIRSKWAAAGAQNGRLGYPTSDEGRGLRNGGAYQSFQGGRIHWSRATGAHSTRGGILSAWAGSGYERGVLGYPTSEEIGGLKDGGSYQTFQGGIIHWSPATGARITRGAIRTAWAAAGSEHGTLGYPTTNEYAFSGGAAQNFQGGPSRGLPRQGPESSPAPSAPSSGPPRRWDTRRRMSRPPGLAGATRGSGTATSSGTAPPAHTPPRQHCVPPGLPPAAKPVRWVSPPGTPVRLPQEAPQPAPFRTTSTDKSPWPRTEP